MPIGNLTSQIFANIYLNELDWFVKHELGVKHYLRYGDDFIVIKQDLQKLKILRGKVIDFIDSVLRLQVNPKHDRIMRADHGLWFLGTVIYPTGRRLKRRNERRIISRLDHRKAGSYYGLVRKHGKTKSIKKFHWRIHQLF